MTFKIDDLTPNSAPTSSFELIFETASAGVYGRTQIGDLLKATAVTCTALTTSAGDVIIGGANDLVFRGATYDLTLASATLTAARSVTVPNLSGTLAVLDGLSDNRLLRADGASGVQQSTVSVSDTGNITGAANVTLSGALATDTIAETTPAAGVTIDGVLLKDGGATFAGGVIADTSGTITLDDEVQVNGSLVTTGEIRSGRSLVATGSALTLGADRAILDAVGGGESRLLSLGVDAATVGFLTIGAVSSNASIFNPIVTISPGVTLSPSINLTLAGGVIADTTGTITLDDDVQVNNTLSATTKIKIGLDPPLIIPKGLSIGASDTDFTTSCRFSNNENSLEYSLILSGTTGTTFGPNRLISETFRGSNPHVYQFSAFAGSFIWTTSNRIQRMALDDLSLTLSSGVDITLAGGVIADSTGEVTFDDPPVLPSYTVAGLPASLTTGAMAYCTDETGGAVPVFYDGTNWRRVTDRAIAT